MKHKFNVIVSIVPPAHSTATPSSSHVGFESDRHDHRYSSILGVGSVEISLDMRGQEPDLHAATAFLDTLSSQLNCYEIDFGCVGEDIISQVVSLQVGSEITP